MCGVEDWVGLEAKFLSGQDAGAWWIDRWRDLVEAPLFQQLVRTEVERRCYDKNAHEDAAQHVMHKIGIAFRESKIEYKQGNFEAFCRQVVINHILGFVRQSRPAESSTSVQIGESQVAAEQTEASSGAHVDVREAIESLPGDQQLVVKLIAAGYSTAEIAERLQISVHAVGRRRRKAFGRLKRILK